MPGPVTGDPPDRALLAACAAYARRVAGEELLHVTLGYAGGGSARLRPPGAGVGPGVGPAPAPGPVWPRPDGWDFRPGEASFNGVRFAAEGRLLALLRALAGRPGEPVPAGRLKREVWGEDPSLVEDGNLQGHVSLLRKRLRDGLGLGADVNPVGHADGAYRLAVY